MPRLLRISYIGLDNVPQDGAALLLSNHQSFLDPVLLGLRVRRPCHFMARDSLFAVPLLGRLLPSLNALPVRRGSADLTAIRESLRRLRAGGMLVAFPEGTRSGDGRIGPLKSGAIVLAQRAEVPIVPAVVEGLAELWPRGRRWPRRGPCWVEYGRVLEPRRFADSPPDQACAELGRVLRDLHNGLRRRVGREPFLYND